MLGLTVAVAITWWWTAGDPSPTPSHPRRVILITIDTLRADALGSYGRGQAATPWMDRLAGEGARFERARAHNVVTLPSHANILSGRYPFDHGVRDNAGFRFPAARATLATLLKARGFHTGAFISAFPLDSRFGLDRGFDVYDDEFVGAAAQRAFLVQERAGPDTVARARRWLEAQGDAPVFCWIHLYEPHFPYAPPAPLDVRYRDNGYQGEVAASDAALAPLLQPLLAEGDRGQTLLVLTSDHGESLGEHGEATHGILAYEAALRVPLIVYHPGSFKALTVPESVRHVDIMPTILDMLGMPIPADIAGRSLLPLMRGQRDRSEPTYFEAMSGNLNRGWAPLRGLVRNEVKFVDTPVAELYDLSTDPGETRNAASGDARVGDLRALLARIAPDAPVTRAPIVETTDTRDQLRSLGYVGGRGQRKAEYTADDDPKNLMDLDRLLQEVVGHYLDGDRARALDRCRELVRRRPEMAVSLLYLAQLERESGNLRASVDALTRAAALNGDDEETLALLGAHLTEAGRAQEAVDRLGPIARRDAPDINVLVSYALALARLARFDEAVRALDRAQQLDPSNAMLHVHEGTVYVSANDRPRAREEFTAALALANVARAHTSLGVLAAEDGRLPDATAHWDRAVAADPREYQTILGIGQNLARLGRAAEARVFLNYGRK